VGGWGGGGGDTDAHTHIRPCIQEMIMIIDDGDDDVFTAAMT
jgi:hypothetical protein